MTAERCLISKLSQCLTIGLKLQDQNNLLNICYDDSSVTM